MANEFNQKLRALFLITTPKMAKKATEVFEENSVPAHFRLGAMGTATSDVMDILGLGTAEKQMFVSILDKEKADSMLLKLYKALRIGAINSGIAYTLPLNGASKVAFRMLDTADEKNEERRDLRAMSEKKNAMIAAVVNLGYSEDVMNAARGAGAGGGTVIHSRAVAGENVLPQIGALLADEKEIVLIVSSAETKLAIMQAISEKCGANTEAKGIVYSFPIDNVVGLSE